MTLNHLKTLIFSVIVLSFYNSACANNQLNSWDKRVVPTFMTIAGLSVAGVWTADLISGQKVDYSDGFFGIKEKETGQKILPHLLAEYTTASCLIAGAVGLYGEKAWARDVSLIALGALSYTSMNSLSWVVTKKERLPYGIPMTICLIGSGVSFAVLF